MSHHPVLAPSGRLATLDWMRGLAIVLMTIDHASEAFNAGRFASDNALLWKPGTAIPAAQFLTRWITHLCAPCFVFLAGASLALSTHKRLAAGESPRGLDRFHLRRGLLIALLDPLWMSWALRGPGLYLLQVMYALGMSMICMVPLSRLGARALVGVGLLLMVCWEPLAGLLLSPRQPPTLPVALLVTGGLFAHGRLVIAYPLLPWLGSMCLGWAWGRSLAQVHEGSARRQVGLRLAWAGLAALGVFLLVRGLNGYGNGLLYREGPSVLQWLHVAKYPPSLSFDALELGLMALMLSGFWWLELRRGVVRALEPLRVLGQAALFYYLLHVHLLEGTAVLLGLREKLGLLATYVSVVVVLVVLFPACSWYRRYKATHPNGWTRYL